jgi:hypothetical protein
VRSPTGGPARSAGRRSTKPGDEVVIVPAQITEELIRSTPWELVGPVLVFVRVPECNGPQVIAGGARIGADEAGAMRGATR